MSKQSSAIITASSGKSAEIKGFGGVFSCLLEHEVKATKATFDFTGPKISPSIWAQVMEFFEWTYQTEKSESQVRLFVHPEHGWAAWAFPQIGGTGMTSREEDMTSPECTEQRRQFSDADGWLYWGTVHHHCSAGAFASGTDDRDEESQEGIHITVGNLDKAIRDIHCRLYIKGHKFEPFMQYFWRLDEQLLDKADEMFGLFGIYPDLNKAAKMAMCQNSTALYAALTPPWIAAEGSTLFPPQWKLNYKVRQVQTYVGGQGLVFGEHGHYRLGGPDWCHRCQAWGNHNASNCNGNRLSETGGTTQQLSKKEQRKAKHKARGLLNSPNPNGDKKDGKVATMLDDLEAQAAAMGVTTSDFYAIIEALAAGNNGALTEIIVENMMKEKATADDLLMVILEREVRSELTAKEADRAAVQEQLSQANGGNDGHSRAWEWEGYGG